MNGRHTIVIVDDDADDREIMRDAFLNINEELEFVLIENGEKLISHLKHAPDQLPSVIMLDLNMPGKDGRETLKELKSDAELHAVPILVFTTSSSPRDRNMSYDLGANCFLTKPDTFDKLTDLADSIIRLWLH